MDNQKTNTNVPYGGNDNQLSSSLGTTNQPSYDSGALSSLDTAPVVPVSGVVAQQVTPKSSFLAKAVKRADVVLTALLILGSIGLVLAATGEKNSEPAANNSAASKYDNIEIPLNELSLAQTLPIGVQSVTINGALQLNNGVIISPSLQPANAKPGQIYYDQGTNQLAYFNGSDFIGVGAGVQSVGGASGAIQLGTGLGVQNGQITNTGVLSIQGQSGSVTLVAGSGIAINGTTIGNAGIVTIVSGGSNLTVTNDGNGNVTLTPSAAGSGTVTSSGGTVGQIPIFTSAQNLEDSLIMQSGLTVTVTGDLSVVTGGLSLSNALTVSNGGTGATSLAANGVIIGSGTSALTSVTSGAPGLCFVSTAGAPNFAACPSGSGVTSLNGLTGALSVANASASGSTITLDNASTAAKGIATFNSTNFSDNGAGTINTIQNINSGATPTFAGVNTNSVTPSAALTIGATGQQLTLQGNASTQLTATGGGFTTTVGFTGTPAGAVTYNFDRSAVAGTYSVCSSAGNCAGVGGSVGGTGTLNRLAKFTATGSTIGDSTISDNGTTVTTTVDLTIQGGEVTVGVPSSQTGSVILAHSGSANTGTIVQGALTGNRTYTLPDANGTFCLTSGNCSGTGSSNTLQAAYDAGNSITTTDARDIDIVLANTATDSNLDIVIADDSTSTVSISRLNGTGTNNPSQLLLLDNLDTNQAIANGIVIQSAAGAITDGLDVSDNELVNALNVGDNNILGAAAVINFTNFDVDSSGNVSAAGNMNLTSSGQYQINGSQISSANLSNDANLAKLNASQTFTGNTNAFKNGSDSTNGFNVQNATGNRILTIDTSGGQVVLGVGSTLGGKLVFNNVSTNDTVTIQPGTLTGNHTLTLPDVDGEICTDSGNCDGAGATLQTAYNFSVGGTTPKIKLNSTLNGVDIQDADTTIGTSLFNVRESNGSGLGQAMFSVGNTGAVTLQNGANSTTAFRLLTDGGTTVLTGDTQNGQIILGQGGTLAGNIVFQNATNSNQINLTTTVATGAQTITLPDATGTVCLSVGNCSGTGSTNTLQAAYDAGNTITTSTGRNLSVTLADSTADSSFSVTTDTNATGFTTLARANGSGTADPAQLLLIDNLDADRTQPIGLKLQATFGLTTAIDATDAEIGTALSVAANDIQGTTGNIDWSNFDVTGSSGNITTAGDVAVNGGDITSTGALTVNGNGTAFTLGTGSLTLASNIDLLLQGATAYISNPQGQTGSEAFGLNATAAGPNSVIVGNGASGHASGGSVAIGTNALGGVSGTAVGTDANAQGNATALGNGSYADSGGVALGAGALTAGFSNSIALGRGATATADNQLVIGGDSPAYISKVVIGSGVTDDGPVGFTLQATSGSGANINGASATIAGGQGTGTGNGGNIVLQVATPGSTGSSLNGLTTVATFSGVDGNALFQTIVDDEDAFNVKTSLGNNIFTVDSINSRVGINLGVSNLPSLTNEGLQVRGALGIIGTSVTSFITPVGSNIDTQFGIEIQIPQDGDQVMALGVASEADGTGTNARVLSIFDERANPHQASLAVFSPNEDNIGGFSWDGSNTNFRVSNSNGSGTVSLTVAGTNRVTAGAAGADVTGILAVSGDLAVNGGDITSTGALNITPTGALVAGVTGQNATLQGAVTTITSNGSGNGISLQSNSSTATIVAKSNTNSATAFQVQDSASAGLLTVDTSARSGSGGNLVKIGNSTGTDTALTILQLDATTADPTSNLSALNGGLFYNSTTHKVSLIENGVVKIICNTTDLGCGTGTVTLQNAYNNSTSPEIVVDGTRGALTVQDNATPIGANLLEVQSNGGGTTYLGVTATGLTTSGDLAVNGGDITSTAGLNIQGAGTNTVDINTGGAGTLSLGNTNTTTINVGGTSGATTTIAGGNVAHTVAIAGAGTSTIQSVTVGSTGSSSSLTLQAGTGNLDIGNDSVAKTTTINIGANSTGADLISLGSANASSTLTLEAGTAASSIQIGNGATAHGIQVGTGAAVQTITIGSTNSTSALTLQAGTLNISLLTTGNVVIGTSDTTGTLLLLDTKTSSGDPSNSVDGAMYYNSSYAQMRCYYDLKWRYCNDAASLSVSTNISDDFAANPQSGYGERVWLSDTNGTAADATGTTSEARRTGIVQLTTGTTTTGRAAIYLNSQNNEIEPLSGGEEIEFAINLGNTSDVSGGTNEFNTIFGLCDQSNGTDCTDGVYVEYDRDQSANWRYATASGGTRTKNNSSTQVQTGWHRFKIVVNSNATSVQFYVDGVSMGTPNTTNIPTATNQPEFVIAKEGTGAAPRTVNVDYFQMRNSYTTGR